MTAHAPLRVPTPATQFRSGNVQHFIAIVHATALRRSKQAPDTATHSTHSRKPFLILNPVALPVWRGGGGADAGAALGGIGTGCLDTKNPGFIPPKLEPTALALAPVLVLVLARAADGVEPDLDEPCEKVASPLAP